MARSAEKTKQPANLFPRDIPRMPDGYYSGDKPNPNLRAFAEQHLRERPYDADSDDYDVPAFDKPIETTKATAIYNMHTYWSKKPHDAIRQYIRHYTRPGDLVLDPFCGSGGTALAALMEGRKAIAIDRSPAATFITKHYCAPANPDELRASFSELETTVKREIDWLYETRCDRCGGKATTGYTVYSQVFQCPRCLVKVPLFDCIEAEGSTVAGKPKKVHVCPHCRNRGHDEIIRSQSEKFGSVPVLVSYICQNGCRPARSERQHDDADARRREYFETHDLGRINEINAQPIPHWYPKGYDMTGFSRYKRDALYYYGVREVADLFTKRNLWALAALREGARSHDMLSFALSSILLNSSRMYRHREGGGGGPKGTDFMIPQVGREIPVWNQYESKVEDLLAVERLKPNFVELMISTQSACSLSEIPAETVDFLFTDPPYAGTIQYGELNCVWEAWQAFDNNWHDAEITISAARGKTESDWAKTMQQAISECYRVLKPGRWLSLCYHDTSEGTWELVQDIMVRVGFEMDANSGALSIDTGQKSYNQLTADKVTKRDLVINFRKPKHESVRIAAPATDGDQATFNENARGIIAEFLGSQPGSTKDRVYDAVVSRLVRAGQMQSHDFEQLLRSVADEVREPRRKDLLHNEDPNLFGTHVASRWYLKDTESGADESDRLTADSAASRVCAFLIQRSSAEMSKSEPTWNDLQSKVRQLHETLTGLPETEESRQKSRIRKELRETQQRIDKLAGQRAQWQQRALHYSEIMEFYLPLSPKPRASLIELLEDYCYQTDEGHWRPPAGEDETKAKADARGQATRRKVNQLCKAIDAGQTIPASLKVDHPTLAAWLRYCKQSGLYAQGKTLYEKAGLEVEQLPDDLAAGVEEDYQTCVRVLARTKLKPQAVSRRAGS